MKTSSTLGLGVVAAALVAGALFYGRHEETIISEAQAPVKTISPGITSNTVERIEIAVPGETSTSLTKRDGVWYTNVDRRHRADKGAVNGIFTALEKELAGEVVSSDPDSYADYQVNETSGTRVRLYEPGKSEASHDFLIGKDGAAAFTTFMREAHGTDVINARASLSYTFKRAEGWRDKQILEFPQDAVTRVAAEGTSSTFEVAKNEAGTWKVLKPDLGDAQPTKVTPMLSMASTLRANEFVETTQPLAELGLDPPRQKLTITYDDKSTSPPKSETAILLIGDKKSEGQYYAKRPDADDVYSIGEYMATTFAPEPNSLALTPPAPPATETTATASLETTATATGETTGIMETAPAPAPADTPTTGPAPGTLSTQPAVPTSDVIRESASAPASGAEASTSTENAIPPAAPAAPAAVVPPAPPATDTAASSPTEAAVAPPSAPSETSASAAVTTSTP
ncbi:MAG: DUF4340 domain-containing protein [Candidatus Sumerlaeaceae bacterium]